MRILLSNDDGIHSPGLDAIHRELSRLGEVVVVAPATEQSGVGHLITFLSPLTCKSIHRNGRHWAWAVDGSPADCVKLAITELFKDEPIDLVVSGMNNGLNCGINVLYSGTVAAAIEGAFFGIPSIAVSLEDDQDDDVESAAKIATEIIQQIAGHLADAEVTGQSNSLGQRVSSGKLFNINIPTNATRQFAKGQSPERCLVPMGLAQYGRSYESRHDPKGKPYYWALWSIPEQPPHPMADVAQLQNGRVTITPLDFNLTDNRMMETMRAWKVDTPLAPPIPREPF